MQVTATVIGRNCRIGKGAQVVGCYLLDGVVVHEGAQISHSLLCDGVVIGANAAVNQGCILSFKVC